jgi:hypothetical protein
MPSPSVVFSFILATLCGAPSLVSGGARRLAVLAGSVAGTGLGQAFGEMVGDARIRPLRMLRQWSVAGPGRPPADVSLPPRGAPEAVVTHGSRRLAPDRGLADPVSATIRCALLHPQSSGKHLWPKPTTGQEPPEAPAPAPEKGRKWYFWPVVGLGALVAVFVIGLVSALLIAIFADPEDAANWVGIIRDIFIIILAMEGMLMGLALIVLVLQVAALLNLLQNEIQPVVDNANETVTTVRGTAQFISQSMVEPVVKFGALAAGLGAALREAWGIRQSLHGTGDGQKVKKRKEREPRRHRKNDGRNVQLYHRPDLRVHPQRADRRLAVAAQRGTSPPRNPPARVYHPAQGGAGRPTGGPASRPGRPPDRAGAGESRAGQG